MKRLPRYWRFLAANGGVRMGHAVLILFLGAGAVVAEAFGLTMMLPVIEYIDIDGDLSALEEKNSIWKTLIGTADFVSIDLNLGVMTGFVVAAVVFRQGFDYFHAVTLASVTAKIQQRLRLRIYEGFQTSHLGFVQDTGSGRFLNLMDRQAEGAALIVKSCADFAKYIFTFLVYAGVMIAAAPLSSVASIAMLIVFVLIVQRYVRRTRALSIEMVGFRTTFSSFVSESFRAARTVRIFSLQDRQRDQLNALTEKYSVLLIGLARMAAIVPLTIGPLIAAAVMGYLYFTFTYLDMTTSTITLFALILMRLAPSSQSFAKQQQNFAQFGANLEALEEFGIAATREHEVLGGEKQPARLRREIAFENVSFAYDGAEFSSLDNICTRLSVGKIIALKGPSGAGKSTFADMLPALIEPGTGAILYDGEPLGDFNREALRGQISYAAQEAFIFAGNVKENVRLARPDASDLAIEAACKAAYAHEFIMALPNGYESNLGEAGATLSGGQKQRLALARCFLKEASILILDEPSSALDPESENMVFLAVREYVENHQALALLITHREAAIEYADEVIELDTGKVVAHRQNSSLTQNVKPLGKVVGS
jgi:ABC-type bacteriocin/lantibiotic exporter with double-glycine peptidase domain